MHVAYLHYLYGEASALAHVVLILTSPVVGALADHSGRKKGFLFMTTVQTVGACALLFFVQPGAVALGMLLFIVGTVGFEGGYVFYNAFLPEVSTPRTIGRVSAWSWGTGFLGGLAALRKPVLHLHTQFNRDLPWDTIDMDFMNLNQSAHGGREFGFIGTRMRIDRKVVVGHWQDETVRDELATWVRAAAAWHDAQGAKIARFGDNMREVAVTEGSSVGWVRGSHPADAPELVEVDRREGGADAEVVGDPPVVEPGPVACRVGVTGSCVPSRR